MTNKSLGIGLLILALGLLATSVSSFFGHVAILGTATDFVRGFCDGLAVVAFAAAIVVLIRSTRPSQR